MYDHTKKDEPCSDKEVKTVIETVTTQTEFTDGTVETKTSEKVIKYPLLTLNELDEPIIL